MMAKNGDFIKDMPNFLPFYKKSLKYFSLLFCHSTKKIDKLKNHIRV
jgi:hypothetical protein